MAKPARRCSSASLFTVADTVEPAYDSSTIPNVKKSKVEKNASNSSFSLSFPTLSKPGQVSSDPYMPSILNADAELHSFAEKNKRKAIEKAINRWEKYPGLATMVRSDHSLALSTALLYDALTTLLSVYQVSYAFDCNSSCRRWRCASHYERYYAFDDAGGLWRRFSF